MGRDTVGSRPRRPRRRRRILVIALLTFAFLVVALLSLSAGAYVSVARTLPSLNLGDRIASPETTKIYDGSPTPVLLAELRGLENRDVLAGDQIPQVMRDAIVAIQDPEFYVRTGVDFLAILRAAWADLWRREAPPGGSAITRELIKNAFVTEERKLDPTVREAALAYELENRWPKERILNEYLNVVYFGSGAYGIQPAARSYFGVDAKDLSVAQAALLAGLPDAPSAYSPRRDPEAALSRRDLVLNKMYQQRLISSEQLQEALATPLDLADTSVQAGDTAAHWVELIREQLLARYGSSAVLGGGLRVYTSLDARMQQAAEAAVGSVAESPGGLSAALVAIDPRSGRMVAMVGGSDPSSTQINLATQGGRFAGSAFEPFVLIAALEKGISPEATYESGAMAFGLAGGPWQVASPDEGRITLAKATACSSDGVYARVAMEVGAQAVAETAVKLGMTAPPDEQLAPAIALAGLPNGVSPLEMALAYTTLASGGERLSAHVQFDPSRSGYPVTVVRVTDGAGKVVDDNATVRTRVIDPGLAALVTECLREAMAEVSGQAADIGRPAAGKTGTSPDGRDAWFVGYTPDLVAAVWVGYPDAQRSGAGSGAADTAGDTLAAQIWASFMKAALVDTPASDFPTESLTRWATIDVCSESRLPPTELCPTVVKRLFRTDALPTDSCGIHVPKAVFMPDVVGMSVSKAKRILGEANLKVKTVQDNRSLEPAGTVIKQDAPAGKPILQGSQVVLRVSSGQATKVPGLVGLSVDQAQSLLAKAGLSGEIAQQSADAPAGTVLAQDPAAGSVLSKGSTVRLTVSSGPETPPST